MEIDPVVAPAWRRRLRARARLPPQTPSPSPPSSPLSPLSPPSLPPVFLNKKE